MVKRKVTEQPAVEPDVVPIGQQDPDGDEGYYAIRPWLEASLIESGPEVDFIDEVTGSILYYRDCVDREQAGRFRAYMVRFNEAAEAGWSAFQLLDSHSQDLADLYPALFDPATDDFRESLIGKFDLYSGNLLMLDTVEVLPAHRGRSLGLAVANRLIDLLAGPGTLVVCCPAPLQFAGEYSNSGQRRHDKRFRGAMQMDQLTTDRPLATRRLRRYWRRLGFTQVGRSPFFILSTSHFRPSNEELCDPSLL